MRLLRNIKEWFFEKGGSSDQSFSYRFTGKESRLFCWHFMTVIAELLKYPDLDYKREVKLYALAFMVLKLRNAVSLYSRVNINAADVPSLKENCRLFLNTAFLFTSGGSQTVWTIGYVILIALRSCSMTSGMAWG